MFHSYHLDLNDLKKEIRGRGLSAVVMSNPRNPTGELRYGLALLRYMC